MCWKPISEITDADVELAWKGRLMLWNSCNGPYHGEGATDGYFTADDVKLDGMWEKFLILPEAG